MGSIRVLFLLLLSLNCFGQMLPIIPATQNQRSSGGAAFARIDSVSIAGIKTAATKDPETIIGRTDETVELTASVFNNGSSTSSLTTYAWSIADATDGSIDFTGTGATVDVSALPEKPYHVTVTATSLNVIPREYIYGLIIEPPIYSEGEADLVIDMAQLAAGTWSNPLGNLDASDQGTNSALDFGEVSRPGFKIAIKNNFTGVNIDWIGLEGTEASPVRIQNVGGVVTNTQTSTQQLWLFGEGSQSITIDGYGLGTKDGIVFMGKTTSGDQSQLIYFIGNFIKNIKILGVYFDQTRDTYGFTAGGATVQFAGTQGDGSVSSGCNGNEGDGGYFTPGYFWTINCTFLNMRDEGLYLGHFDVEPITGIYRPYRIGYILVLYNYFESAGRDFIQFTATTGGVVCGNYGTIAGLENNSDQNTAVSLNDGNTGDMYVIKNYFENMDVFCSAQNGDTGNGDYFFYGNFGEQNETTTTNPNQFFFYNIEDQIACHMEQFNNTFKCPDVNIAPLAIQHDLGGTYADATYVAAYNVMSTGGTNQTTFPELRRVGNPGAGVGGYTVTNTWERTADEADLKLSTATYRPNDATSPAFGAGVTHSTYLGGNTDIDGFSLLVDGGYTAGCFAGKNLFIP